MVYVMFVAMTFFMAGEQQKELLGPYYTQEQCVSRVETVVKTLYDKVFVPVKIEAFCAVDKTMRAL